MNAVTATSEQRSFVLLPSGNILNLARPDPLSWTNSDLAIGLSRTYRWGGHSAWTRPLSVAQHSLSVLAIRESVRPLPAELALYELMHDAEEGLLGFDCIAPLKSILGEPFEKLCRQLTNTIASRYPIPVLTPNEYRLHKLADRTAAASEAVHIVGWSAEQVRDELGIEELPLGRDPLSDELRDPFKPWEPWPSERAADRWLNRVQKELNSLETTNEGAVQ